jgi:hypothetical protein
MAHPKRKLMVKDLNENLLDRKLEPVWDRYNDRHETGKRSLEAFDPEATHHLVLQDDALPCPNLVAGIEHALRYMPENSPMVGYLGRVSPFAEHIEKLIRGHKPSWIVMDGVYWGPCVVVPTAILPELIEFYSKQTIQNYDRRISLFFESLRIQAWYPFPSLVQHRDSKSLAHDTKGRRCAHKFVGEDALKMKWTGEVMELRGSRRLDAQRQKQAAPPLSA